MKSNICIISLILIIYSSSFSQELFKQNNMSAGGNFSYSSKASEGVSDNLNILNLTPQFDYFIIDNLSIGLIVNIESTNREKFFDSNLGFGPNLRYYFQVENLYPFAGVSFIYSNHKYGYDETTQYKVTETQFVLSAGIEILLSSSVTFEPILSYKFVNEKYDESLNNEFQHFEFWNGKTEMSSNIFEIGFGLKYFF